MTPRLIYGFDPLCGWCYGFVPAMQAVQAAFPDLVIELALPGLVTGPRVGPYAAMEGYIRGASDRLRSVTGRAPSEAFFHLISDPSVIASSAPPALVLATARTQDSAAALRLAHRLIDAHFGDGADYNNPALYPALMVDCGLAPDLPDLHDEAAAQRLWSAERHHGIASFPTLIVERDGEKGLRMPSLYAPDEVVEFVREATFGQPAKTGARPVPLR